MCCCADALRAATIATLVDSAYASPAPPVAIAADDASPKPVADAVPAACATPPSP